MPYDNYLEERISRVLNEKRVAFEPKKMMGGLCYMVEDKMCLGINGDRLMVRINPEDQAKFEVEHGAGPMDFTKRPMKGYLFISAEGVDSEADLEKWIDRCLAFNPLAKSSKKKK